MWGSADKTIISTLMLQHYTDLAAPFTPTNLFVDV